MIVISDDDTAEKRAEVRRKYEECLAEGRKPHIVIVLHDRYDPKKRQFVDKPTPYKGDPWDLPLRIPKEATEFLDRVTQAIGQEIEPEPEPHYPIEIGEIPDPLAEEPTPTEVWYRVEELANADFCYYEQEERVYLMYAPGANLDEWRRCRTCPWPEGAMIKNWPPQTEKEWRICKEVYQQAVEDSKTTDDTMP